jgi:hypothetical protein
MSIIVISCLVSNEIDPVFFRFMYNIISYSKQSSLGCHTQDIILKANKSGVKNAKIRQRIGGMPDLCTF